MWVAAGLVVAAGIGAYASHAASKAAGKINTQEVRDPLKTAVSSPLSEFLAKQIGKSVPRYGETTGNKLYQPIDPKAYNTYQDFLSVSPSEWYTKGVEEPTMKAMRKQIPLISENWAGGLRGSGHFADVEDYMQDTETLAEGRYKAELEIPQAQFSMAQSYSERRNEELALDYADWYQSLPENNPVLEKAMVFLNSDSGVTTLTSMGGSNKAASYGQAASTISTVLSMYAATRGVRTTDSMGSKVGPTYKT